jgi:hypothetical protein
MKKKARELNPIEGLDGQLMVMAAHRYCLGRQTYIVSSCIDWLRLWWPKFERNTRRVIVRDTIDALQHDNAGSPTCDVPGWRELARWAYGELPKEDQDWCVNALAHNGKEWPL